MDYAEKKGVSLDNSSGWEDEINNLLKGTNYKAEKIKNYYKHRGKEGEINWNETYVILKEFKNFTCCNIEITEDIKNIGRCPKCGENIS